MNDWESWVWAEGECSHTENCHVWYSHPGGAGGGQIVVRGAGEKKEDEDFK